MTELLENSITCPHCEEKIYIQTHKVVVVICKYCKKGIECTNNSTISKEKICAACEEQQKEEKENY